jgi:hypothetical protein
VLRVALGRDDGTFAFAPNSDTIATFAQHVVVADVNRDGRPDVVLGGLAADGVVVWYGKGDGTASRVEFYDLPRSTTDVAVADIDEDGRLDLIATTEFDHGLQIRLALATWRLRTRDVPDRRRQRRDAIRRLEPSRTSNLDGHLDVVTDNLDILYGRGDGTFAIDRSSTFGDLGFSARWRSQTSTSMDCRI